MSGSNVFALPGAPSQAPAGPNTLATTPGAAGPSVPGPMVDNHGAIKARYNGTKDSLEKVAFLEAGMERLGEMGDMVTQEDIVKEAGKLVGRGIDPLELAGVLAGMPVQGGGAALAGWLQQHTQALVGAKQQLQQAHAEARHQLGVSSLHIAAAHSLGPGAAPMAQNTVAPGASLAS